ncbi:MAG: ATP-binding protein, partial [Aeoliella sp.]
GLFPLEPTAIGELDDLKDRIEEHERQRDILKGQRHQLRKEADELGINEVLVKNCCRVEGLSEQQEWLESLAQQSDEHEAEANQLASQFENETSRLAQQWFNDPKRRLVLTPEQIDQLSPQRVAMEGARKQLSTAEVEFEAYRGEEEKYRSQLETATTSSEKMGLPTDLQSAGDLVARLRRRLSVEQKIEQTRRSGVELDQQARDMQDGQVLPLRLYVFWGACVFGAAALIAAWALTEGRPELGQAGAVLAAISVVIPFFRWANEARVSDDLDNVHRQIDTLNRQLTETRTEKDQLDKELPVADGSVVLRLQTAERHLADLEDILPVESDRRRATEASRSAKLEYETARERMANAERDWRGQLKALGLPEALTPKELNLLAGQYEQLAQLETQAQTRRDEMQRRQREFDRVVGRIERLAQESGLALADSEPLAQLEHLLAESRLQKAHLAHRDKLRERAKELKGEEARHARTAMGLARKRDALFQKAGVDHETAFRKLAADLFEAERLSEERTNLTREIVAAIGALGEEEDFEPFFSTEALAKLEAEWEKLTADHETVESQLDALLKERATLVEQQRRLADDSSLSDRQIELGITSAQLQRAQEAWRERAVVSRMLEHIRHDYEQHRQPETLLEATDYFRELTGGAYTRVWTPLANDVLFVDRADGQSLAVDALSRGTREQLFLSVRLAVVAMFARRGIQLPMILDDVLVNYDEQRAATAAKVLCEFASQGHQLMVFSCHEHILAIFKKLSADCRRLPSRVEEAIEELPVPVEEIVEEVVEETIEVQPPPEEVVEEVVLEEDVLDPEPIEFIYTTGIMPRRVLHSIADESELLAEPMEIEYDWRHDDPHAAPENSRFGNAVPLVHSRPVEW